MRTRTAYWVVAAVMLVSATASRASLLDSISIERECHIRQYNPDDTENSYGVGVEPYSSAIFTSFGRASQDSIISDNYISFVGYTHAYIDADNVDYQPSSACYSDILLRESFLLTSWTPFSFSAKWFNGGYSQFTSASLAGPLGDVFRKDSTSNVTSGNWVFSGNLAPGMYTYEIKGSASSRPYRGGHLSGFVTISADLSLLPEPTTAIMFILTIIPLTTHVSAKQSKK